MQQTELIIEGAGCASCVGKIESALKTLPGVNDAIMNFAQRTVLVEGEADIDSLITAIEVAGYNARSSGGASDGELLKEKEEADWAYYKRLMRDMTVGLGFGVPLMAYGLMGGPMTVNTLTERGVWLFVGVLCACVM